MHQQKCILLLQDDLHVESKTPYKGKFFSDFFLLAGAGEETRSVGVPIFNKTQCGKRFVFPLTLLWIDPYFILLLRIDSFLVRERQGPDLMAPFKS